MRIKLFFFLLIILFYSCDPDNPDEGGGNEELPKVSISSVSLFEGNENQEFEFEVRLNNSSDKTIQVDYATEEISAGEFTDFQPESSTITFLPGETSSFIDIEIIADEWKETDEEFKVVLSNPSNATILTGEGVGTIRNDDTEVMVNPEGYITPLTYPGRELVWNDEFDGDQLDTGCWTREVGGHGWGNNELQYYTDREENAYLADGSLIIEAKEESFDNRDYTSARIITKDNCEYAFGRVDVRAILPEGQGIWPAIWMLGGNFAEVGWPACGEIDIMELVGHEPSRVHGTAHWGPQGQSWSHNQGEHYDISGKKFSEEFHVFTIIWEPGKIEWFVNDNKFFTLTPATVSEQWRFDQEFFFIMNIAVGGNWPGSPNSTTQFPQQMIVDYIRVFQ